MIETAQALNVLMSLLSKAETERQLFKTDIITNVFHEFSKIEVDCAQDDFFFQCGVFDFTGERLFYWDIVRQFMIDSSNEYSHMEQLHYEIQFEPNAELEEFEAIEWRIRDKDTYFERLSDLDEFKIPIEKYVPKYINIYQERV